jgi:hypothetical protein
MQSTPAGATPHADFGTATMTLILEGERCQKLLRFRNLKAQLRALRAEYEQLEAELFAEPRT